jgi:hypothetical protein
VTEREEQIAKQYKEKLDKDTKSMKQSLTQQISHEQEELFAGKEKAEQLKLAQDEKAYKTRVEHDLKAEDEQFKKTYEARAKADLAQKE